MITRFSKKEHRRNGLIDSLYVFGRTRFRFVETIEDANQDDENDRPERHPDWHLIHVA